MQTVGRVKWSHHHACSPARQQGPAAGLPNESATPTHQVMHLLPHFPSSWHLMSWILSFSLLGCLLKRRLLICGERRTEPSLGRRHHELQTHIQKARQGSLRLGY
jgi:hypothetical protein